MYIQSFVLKLQQRSQALNLTSPCRKKVRYCSLKHNLFAGQKWPALKEPLSGVCHIRPQFLIFIHTIFYLKDFPSFWQIMPSNNFQSLSNNNSLIAMYTYLASEDL
jgi:hypothetical protein